MIIFDDINLNEKSKYLDLIATLGRHLNCCTILSVQYPKIMVSNIIRSNVDMMFISKLNNKGLEACYEVINTGLNKKHFY